MLCPAVHRRGRGREGTEIRLLALHTTNPSFSANTFLSNIIHSPTSSQCHSVTPFPNSNATLPSLHTLQYSSSHFPGPTILLTSSASTHQSLSNSPHVTNKYSTSSPVPLSHITNLSSIIILHLFLSPNNPAEPVLSVNSSLTTS